MRVPQGQVMGVGAENAPVYASDAYRAGQEVPYLGGLRTAPPPRPGAGTHALSYFSKLLVTPP